MRVKASIFIALVLLFNLWGESVYADGVPPEPHAFWGYATVNGNPAPVGTDVEARVESDNNKFDTATEGRAYHYRVAAEFDLDGKTTRRNYSAPKT